MESNESDESRIITLDMNSEDEDQDFRNQASSRPQSRSSTISYRSRAESTTSTRARRGSATSISSAVLKWIRGKPDPKSKRISELEQENMLLREENKKMRHDHREENEKMRQYHKGLQDLIELYKKKFEQFEPGNVGLQINVQRGNVQVGDHNAMVASDANETLLLYYNALKKSIEKLDNCTQDLKEKTATVRELDNLVDELRDKKNKLEDTVDTLEIEKNKFQEVIDSLREMQVSMDARDNAQRIKLDYTLSLTDSQLMEKCIHDLQQLEDCSRPIGFNDVTNNAQFGVMRIIRKYCTKDPKLTVHEFARTLEVDIDYNMADRCLDNDTCTDILVKWTHLSPNNTVEVLMQKYPKLKRYGSIYGNIGSQSMGTLSRLDFNSYDGTPEFLREMKSWITEHTKIADDALFQRISAALAKVYLTAPRRSSLKRRTRSLDSLF